MELRPNLGVQARQAITITPQVIQSIKLLKYGHNELLEFLRDQEERNPLIEVVSEVKASREAVADTGEPAMMNRPAETAVKEIPSPQREVPRALSDRTRPISGATGGFDSDMRTLEETCASKLSLREHVLRQVYLTVRDPADLTIAIEIAESLDPDGYLRRDLHEIADHLGTRKQRVEQVLRCVQTIEPAGIAARDLSECLSNQLRDQGRLTDPMGALLDNLELLAAYDFDKLARICAVDKATLNDMARTIRELDPRPGRRFDTDPVMPALPDLKLDLESDGTFRVELNSELLPKVLVDREYYSEMRASTKGEDETRFVVDCMKKANWLTRNLDQRANTVLKVATAIVSHQRDFFLHGVEHIRPLCQSDIAKVVGMHPSTICRATSEKYIMTNRGMFELKFFFWNAITTLGDRENYSAESIRGKIRNLVEAEPSNGVLSDNAIMACLRKEGVSIARRTVAKYREMMHIPSSQIRKRQKRAAA